MSTIALRIELRKNNGHKYWQEAEPTGKWVYLALTNEVAVQFTWEVEVPRLFRKSVTERKFLWVMENEIQIIYENGE